MSEISKEKFDIPVVFFVFKRLSTVEMIIEIIRQIKPSTMYIFADGARPNIKNEIDDVEAVRRYIKEAIDWECDSKSFYFENNKGCDRNIREGLDLVFSEQSKAIIFEDDAVPTVDFFMFGKKMLDIYENDKRIQFIAGFNAIGDSTVINESYSFGMTVPMNGAFATWADRWNECDFDMKRWPLNKKKGMLNNAFFYTELRIRYKQIYETVYKKEATSWDYIFEHDMLDKERLAIVPKYNLVTSYGYVEGAYHPQKKSETEKFKEIMTANGKIDIANLGSLEVKRDDNYDRVRQKKLLLIRGNYYQRHIKDAYQVIKDFAYKYLPRRWWEFLKKISN